jgi:AAA domain-containing protein
VSENSGKEAEASIDDGGSDDFWARNSEPRAEIVSGLLREGQIVALAGPFGVAKTPVIADLSVHVLNGIPWCGHEVRRRPVIALDFETDGPSYRKRLQDISKYLGVAHPRVPQDLEVYLEHDSADEPATSKLLKALGSKVEHRVALLEEALQRKPDALLIIDPVELYFRFDTTKKMHVLSIYGILRQLLCKYPKAAIILTFNLRKRDRRSSGAPDLLRDPRGWLEEICGSLDLLNRSDGRWGLDIHQEDVRVLNGIRRGEEMEPTLIRPITDSNGNLAGFERCPADTLTSKFAFTPGQLAHWQALPSTFRFEAAANTIVPRSTLSRILRRAKSLGLVSEADGVWTKRNELDAGT